MERSANPDLDDKITEIMTLIGVSPRDFKRAAANFRRMSPPDLDARLTRLHASERRLEAWRAEQVVHHAPAQAAEQAPSIDELTQKLEASNAFINRHLNDLISLVDRLQRWQRAVPGNIGLAVSAMVERIGAYAARRADRGLIEIAERARRGENSVIGQRQLVSSLNDSLSKNQATVAAFEAIRQQIAELLNHPILWSDSGPVQGEAAVQALARMENSIDFYKPDMLVGMNAEGFGISQVVKADLGLTVPIVKAYGDATTVELEGAQGLHPRTVCIVGHVAWSGETLERARKLLGSRYNTDRIFGAVLVASTSAAERLRVQGPFVYHQVTEATQFDLSFDPAKGVSIERDQYVIGAGPEGLPVTRESLRLARTQLAAAYRGSMEGWK